MGQYHIPVNLDKREFIMPHDLGAGLKLMEQAHTLPGTAGALLLLLGVSATEGGRGGGDPRSGHPMIGHWGGDRIVVIGDYGERGDIAPEDNADILYSLCGTPEEVEDAAAWQEELAKEAEANGGKRYGKTVEELLDKARRIRSIGAFKDISAEVADMIEQDYRGKFSDEGWRRFTYDGAENENPPTMIPDMVIYGPGS